MVRDTLQPLGHRLTWLTNISDIAGDQWSAWWVRAHLNSQMVHNFLRLCVKKLKLIMLIFSTDWTDSQLTHNALPRAPNQPIEGLRVTQQSSITSPFHTTCSRRQCFTFIPPWWTNVLNMKCCLRVFCSQVLDLGDEGALYVGAESCCLRCCFYLKVNNLLNKKTLLLVFSSVGTLPDSRASSWNFKY